MISEPFFIREPIRWEGGIPDDFLFEDGDEQKRKYTIEERFPCGLVEDVEICMDLGSLVSEVLLTIEGYHVLLLAGEIYEDVKDN